MVKEVRRGQALHHESLEQEGQRVRIGLILECGPDGADKKACELLARRLLPNVVLFSVTLDNKPSLLANCGIAAAQLLREGSERVIIVWDLYPPWRETPSRPCRKEDCNAILQSLTEAGASLSHVHLVCIQEELEAWLIADERAVATVLSTPARPARIPRTRQPERTTNPKGRLQRIYQQHGRQYVDVLEAEKIIRALPDLNRLLRHCPTFVRFAAKITEVTR